MIIWLSIKNSIRDFTPENMALIDQKVSQISQSIQNNTVSREYFKFLNESNISLGLKDLSIGMSGDYKKALIFNATFLRIGTGIFGERT